LTPSPASRRSPFRAKSQRCGAHPGLAQKLAPHRNDAVKPLRLMIMGIPNVGKSTLMNALVKKRSPPSAINRPSPRASNASTSATA
jgi:ribosome biogenesis GTPase A